MTAPDVVVVGGGPAGSATARHLAAAGADVVLVHDGREPWRSVGQQLSASLGRLLGAMGVTERLAHTATPVAEGRSAWTDGTLVCRPALFGPHGPPLAVDRAVFDGQLRDAARAAGVRVVRARAVAAERRAEGWLLSLRASAATVGTGGTAASGGSGGSVWCVPVPVLVDASGSARAMSRTRVGWCTADRIRCTVWQVRPYGGPEPYAWSLTEAAADGWWHSAPKPGSDRLTVVHGRDLRAHDRRSRTGPPRHTAARLGGGVPGGLPAVPGTERVAVVGGAQVPWAARLVAVGDAAVGADPLSSSGLRHALELAGPAAEAARGLLRGDEGPAAAYAALVRAVLAEHLSTRRRVHAAAVRFRDARFWRRREEAGLFDGV